jgi:hypothetical protein
MDKSALGATGDLLGYYGPMHHQNFEIKVNKQVNKSIPIFSCISF